MLFSKLRNVIKNASPIPLPQESRHNPKDKGYTPGRMPDKGHSRRGVLPMPVCQYDTKGDIMSGSSKIGLVKINKGTPDYARASLENFFESKGLFIASIPEGIVVSDTDKAAEEVKKARGR